MADPKGQIFTTAVNSFHYLYQDAGYLHSIANKPEMKDTFYRTQLSRTALILYAVALEALINRAWDAFLPSPFKEFYLERERSFDVKDKWLLLPLHAGRGETFATGAYPWNQFSELVEIRNDFVHPKAKRSAYYRRTGTLTLEPLDEKDVPEELKKITATKKERLSYDQTKIPRDPYSIRPNDLDKAKKVVDGMVTELNRLLDGKLTDEFLHHDELQLIWPPGATVN